MEEKVLERLRYDFYGELLSPKQKLILDYYYNDDYSFAEISELVPMTRQGVHDAYKRAKKQMLEYEEKLGLVERQVKTQGILTKLIEELEFIKKETHNTVQDQLTKVQWEMNQIIEGV